MLYLSYILGYIGILFSLLAVVKVYEKINDIKLKINIYYIILILVSAGILFLLSSIDSITRIIFTISFYFLILKILFKDNNIKILITIFCIYIVIIFSDFLVSIALLSVPFIVSMASKYQLLVMDILTIIETIIFYLLFNFKVVRSFSKKIINFVSGKRSILFILLITFIFSSFCVFAVIHGDKKSVESYVLTLFIILLFVVLSITTLVQYFKNKIQEDEQQKLLALINDYELMLENDRINRHEMLNNLVVLKSYSNKSSPKYEKILDEIIEKYQSKKSNNYSGIYKLPSGIKGVVYYKVANMNDKDINYNTLISEECFNKIEKLDEKEYYIICKIIGILLDNAIEACVNTSDKYILVDIYMEDDLINIYIENTFQGEIDLNKISKKGYSSKGNNRGYGLSIVSNLVKNNNNLLFTQYIKDNKFISVLKVLK